MLGWGEAVGRLPHDQKRYSAKGVRSLLKSIRRNLQAAAKIQTSQVKLIADRGWRFQVAAINVEIPVLIAVGRRTLKENAMPRTIYASLLLHPGDKRRSLTRQCLCVLL